MPVRELSPILAKVAHEELNEDPKRLEKDLSHLKDWISKQPHLNARTDDQWLVGFLRGCKFSLETVKKKLDLYYTLRNIAPDITKRFKPTDPRFIEILKLGVCLVLPKSEDPVQPRLILLRPGAYDPEKYHVCDILCVFYYLIQILVIEDDAACVVGTKTLVDYQGVSVSHIAQTSAGLLKKIVFICQDSMPLRLKGSHHVNLITGLDTALNIVKSFLNEKPRQRLKIHSSHLDLINNVPKESLPTEYTGTAGDLSEIIDYWVNKMTEYRSWMEEENNYGTDESKRVGQPTTAQTLFGVDGSFRKLELD